MDIVRQNEVKHKSESKIVNNFLRNTSVSGFTLAEILVTLVIIGVIAAITVPILIARYQKEQTVTKLKKAYSAIAQTTARAIADNGPVNTWELTGHKTLDSAYLFSEKYLLPYLSVMKNCKNDTSSTCSYSYRARNSQTYNPDSSYAKFFLNDGTMVAVEIEYNTSYPAYTASVLIDINGQQKPNLAGKDVFSFRYIFNHKDYPNYKGKLIPNCFGMGRDFFINNATYGCKSGAGTCCAAIIVNDGWIISDDYPW